MPAAALRKRQGLAAPFVNPTSPGTRSRLPPNCTQRPARRTLTPRARRKRRPRQRGRPKEGGR
eukprot:6788277-Lingulodinium_polyedra.AAC.1